MSIGQTSVVNQTTPFAGVIAEEMGPVKVDSFVNAESSAELPFGALVFKGTGDHDAIIGAADAANPVGIVAFSQAYSKAHGDFPGDLGTVGLKPQVTMNVLTQGVIYVKLSENSVTPASAVRYVQLSGGSNAQFTFRASADSEYTTLLDSGHAKFLDSGSSGDFVRLWINALGMTTTSDT